MAATQRIVTLGYILTFWGALPAALAALAAWGDRTFGRMVRLGSLKPAAAVVAAFAGVMLAAAILQYTKASGSLPISAFPPRRLVRSGLFGVWRHPIYLFSVLLYGSLAVIFRPAGGLLVALPCLAAGTLVYARVEERGLKKRFGDLYEGHRRRTSLIIPRLPHLIRPISAVAGRLLFCLEISGRENGALNPPFFIVSAHRNYLDSVFLSLALKIPIHFITTYEMFRRPASRRLFSRLLALPKRRYRPDIRNALDIRRRLRQGGAVGVFVEAERSWTGEMAGFKPEALKLFRLNRGIPILPVRLEGTYAAWPRWARRPRRSRVSVIVEEPIFPGASESAAELEARLLPLIAPRAGQDIRTGRVPAAGIETLLYRCPRCFCFDAIRSGSGPGFRCSECLSAFKLRPDLSVDLQEGRGRESLPSLAARIRTATVNSLPGLDSGIIRARARLAIEERDRFVSAGPGYMTLSADRLGFAGAGRPVRIELESVRAVVIEGRTKLQVYAGRPALLHQFTLLDQSALKWQDLVVEAARNRLGYYPSTV